jgi:hypothetical protein
MNLDSAKKPAFAFLLIVLAFLFLGVAEHGFGKARISGSRPTGSDDKGTQVISLNDFTKEEVKGAGIILSKDLTVHVSAVGGGDKSFWKETFGDNDSQQMYAAGWIINADTREVVWDMTMDNTSGRANHRTCDVDIPLTKGSYEVYYMEFC